MQNKTVKNKERITETESDINSRPDTGVLSYSRSPSSGRTNYSGSKTGFRSTDYSRRNYAYSSDKGVKTDSYNEYLNKKREYENAKNSQPGTYGAGNYENRLNELADKILNRKEFSYDHTTDENYLAYMKSYRDAGLESAKKALASSSKMSAGYGNSYAFNSAQTAYDQYMAKASDKIPQMYSDAYSRYRDEEKSLYDKYGLLSDEESKLYSRYRDEVSDARYNLSLAYNEMTDSADNYYKDRDYEHTLGRERISDKRYETEYADKLRQQKTENNLNERKYQSELEQRQIENDLNERKYRLDLNQKEIENDLNERKFFESVIHQDFEDDLNERKYQADLNQKKIENSLAERKFDDQVEQEIAESYRYEDEKSAQQSRWQSEYDLNKEKFEETKRQNELNSDYKNKSLEYSRENNERNYELSKRKADSADEQRRKEYNEKIREFDENMIYKKYFS
ncbi:MAG: hypothetical protein SOZ38_09545 [Oscillospiraceae bacterium]|nr:hypothetical protein [Oscillospiraceae bacterium]